jgi:hypothetical protein
VEAHIRNARATSTGEYDFAGPKGERYRYLDLYDDTRGEIVRVSVAKDCTLPAVEFGTIVDLWVELVSNEKIVRGEDRDRAIGTLKLRAISVELSKVGAKLAEVAKAA